MPLPLVRSLTYPLRTSTPQEREVLCYLNDLKAAKKNGFKDLNILKQAFHLTSDEAVNLMLLWCRNYDSDSRYEEVKI